MALICEWRMAEGGAASEEVAAQLTDELRPSGTAAAAAEYERDTKDRKACRKLGTASKCDETYHIEKTDAYDVARKRDKIRAVG